MTLDVAGLVDLPTGPLAITVYLRQCFLPTDGSAPDPLRTNPMVSSRWQTEEGTLYVAGDEITVWAEQCRNAAASVQEADPTGGVGLNAGNMAFYAPQQLADPVATRALYSVDVTLDQVADVTDVDVQDALRAAGVDDPGTDLIADDFGTCPQIAVAGANLGWQAVRAPSAARVGGIALAIFHHAWPPREDWNIKEPSARPTIAIAYLTRYRAGQRPPWLGR